MFTAAKKSASLGAMGCFIKSLAVIKLRMKKCIIGGLNDFRNLA
jgi:hypothetical protein